MRVAAAIALSVETRLRLEKLVRGRSTPVRIVQRSRIVLLAGDGLQNKRIAERMEVAPRMVALWRNRFLTLGVDGLFRDASRPGRTPSITTQPVLGSSRRRRRASLPMARIGRAAPWHGKQASPSPASGASGAHMA